MQSHKIYAIMFLLTKEGMMDFYTVVVSNRDNFKGIKSYAVFSEMDDTIYINMADGNIFEDDAKHLQKWCDEKGFYMYKETHKMEFDGTSIIFI